MSKTKTYIEPLFRTGADELVDLVKKKGRISLGTAAKELGVSKAVIEDWAYYIETSEGTLHIEEKGSQVNLVSDE